MLGFFATNPSLSYLQRPMDVDRHGVKGVRVNRGVGGRSDISQREILLTMRPRVKVPKS